MVSSILLKIYLILLISRNDIVLEWSSNSGVSRCNRFTEKVKKILNFRKYFILCWRIDGRQPYFKVYSGIPISRTLAVSRTSRYLEPNLVSLGFASLKLYNSTPDFSNPRFLETPDNSNQFWLPWDKLTLDNSNLRKFRNHLVRKSITFTPSNKLTLPDKLFFNHTTSHKSVCHQSERYNDCVLLCSAFVF